MKRTLSQRFEYKWMEYIDDAPPHITNTLRGIVKAVEQTRFEVQTFDIARIDISGLYDALVSENLLDKIFDWSYSIEFHYVAPGEKFSWFEVDAFVPYCLKSDDVSIHVTLYRQGHPYLYIHEDLDSTKHNLLELQRTITTLHHHRHLQESLRTTLPHGTLVGSRIDVKTQAPQTS